MNQNAQNLRPCQIADRFQFLIGLPELVRAKVVAD